MYRKLIVGLILFGMLLIGLSTWLLPPRTFSDAENRPLAARPVFTWAAVRSGAYMEDVDRFLQDQLLAKEHWVNGQAMVERWLRKTESNGVYLGGRDRLFDVYRDPGEQFAKNLSYLETFTRTTDIPVHILLAPPALLYAGSDLPPFAYVPRLDGKYRQVKDALGEGDGWVDVRESFAQEGARRNDLFFRTDHHWTAHGAYLAYRQLAASLGFTAREEEDYRIETVSDTFYGSLQAKVHGTRIPPDRLERYVPKIPVRSVLTYDGVEQEGVYEEASLATRDQYRYFLGGNHAEAHIRTDAAPERTLLVIKDSYAHVLLPFLTPHFRDIHVLDLRYYHASIGDYMETHAIDEVLVLYQFTNFAEDPSFGWLTGFRQALSNP